MRGLLLLALLAQEPGGGEAIVESGGAGVSWPLEAEGNYDAKGYLIYDSTDALELGTACTGGGTGDICCGGDFYIADDQKHCLGDGCGYWLEYNSTGTQFELWTTDDDGAGADGLALSVADGTDDVGFGGSITVDNSIYFDDATSEVIAGTAASHYISFTANSSSMMVLSQSGLLLRSSGPIGWDGSGNPAPGGEDLLLGRSAAGKLLIGNSGLTQAVMLDTSTDGQLVLTDESSANLTLSVAAGYFRSSANIPLQAGTAGNQYFGVNVGTGEVAVSYSDLIIRDGVLGGEGEAKVGADSGDGNPGVVTASSKDFIQQCDCNDGDGCDVTFSETNAVDFSEVRFVNNEATTCTVSDSAGVQEMAGGVAFAMGQYDVLVMMYLTDRWVEVSRSDN